MHSSLLKPALLAAGISLAAVMAVPATAVMAAETHSHQHQKAGAAAPKLKLNNGAPWQTDEALRRGMSEIRQLTGAAVPRIHKGAFAAKDYRALAQGIQAQVDFVVGNCKLPEEADEQLHIVLEEVLDGIRLMQGQAHQKAGAEKVIHALEAYGKHFDHPGWVSITERQTTRTKKGS